MQIQPRLGQPVEKEPRLAVLAPAAEPAAVQVDERRTARRPRAVPVDVERVPPARVAVGDVRHALDVGATDGERCEQARGDRRSSAAWWDGRAGQAVGQRARHRGAGLRRPPRREPEPERRHDGERQRGRADRSGEIALAPRQRRRGEEPAEADRRQLVDHEAEPVAQSRPARPSRGWRSNGAEREHRHEDDRDQIADGHPGW